MSPFQEKLAAQGYCDERGAGFCATATKLPDGELGLVALCVKGNVLTVYDVDIRSNLGEMLYQVKLSEIEGLKIRCNIFSQVLRFNYLGDEYSFTNFLGVKPALAVIEAESGK